MTNWIEDQPVATWSEDRKYRYSLIRRSGFVGDSMVLFIMLNPSTADEDNNDPTIRRCVGFANRWGCDWLYICNLSPLRSTDPKGMIAAGPEPDEIWDQNIETIRMAALNADEVIVAWGVHGRHESRDTKVLLALNEYFGLSINCLGKTKDGFPRHPLYVPWNTEVIPYE